MVHRLISYQTKKRRSRMKHRKLLPEFHCFPIKRVVLSETPFRRLSQLAAVLSVVSWVKYDNGILGRLKATLLLPPLCPCIINNYCNRNDWRAHETCALNTRISHRITQVSNVIIIFFFKITNSGTLIEKVKNKLCRCDRFRVSETNSTKHTE